MPKCRRCAASSVHRSRTRGALEAIRRALTGRRPYRCRSCGWRGWAREPMIDASERDAPWSASVLRDGTAASPPLEVELEALDVPAPPQRRTLSDILSLP